MFVCLFFLFFSFLRRKKSPVRFNEETREGGVLRVSSIIQVDRTGQMVLQEHLRPGIDVNDSLHGALIIMSMPAVGNPSCDDAAIQDDAEPHRSWQMLPEERGLEVVDTGHRSREDSGRRVVGVAQVGDRVVQDHSAAAFYVQGL